MMILLLTLICLFQDIPTWLDATLTDDNRELVLSDIEQLIDEKIDFSTSAKKIHTTLYFIPDSLLSLYKRKPESLSSFDRYFIGQFDQKDQELINSNYSLYRNFTPATDDRDDYLGDRSSFKSIHQFRYKSVHLSYANLKLRNEKFSSHQFFLLSHSNKWFDLHAGQFSLNGANPLSFSRPFGKRFVANQRLIRPAFIRVNAQRSINKQNYLNGFMLTTNQHYFTFGLIYGVQKHSVSYKDDHFESFNFYFPHDRTESIASKKTIDESDFMSYLNLNPFSNYSLTINFLHTKLSEPFIRTSDYRPLKIQNESYLSLIQQIEIDPFQFSFNHSIQFKGKHALEISMSTEIQTSKLEAAYFYYDDHYLNTHSTGFMDGANFAWNRNGYFLQFSTHLSNQINSYIALLNDKELYARDFDQLPKNSTKIESGIDFKLNKHRVFLLYSESGELGKFKFTHQYQPKRGHYLIQQHTTYQNGSYYNQFRYVWKTLRCGFGYGRSDSGITVYEYGLNREFLTDYIKGKLIYLFSKYRFDLTNKLQISSIAHFKKDVTVSSNVRIDFAVALSYSI